MSAVPLQRAFDLSAGYVLTLRERSAHVPPRKRPWWHWRVLLWRLTHRRFAAPVMVAPEPPLTFTVPPLSLGRFLDLMATDWNALSGGLLRSDLVEAAGRDVAEFIGRQLAGMDHRAFSDLVCAVVPGMIREVWEEHGDMVAVFRLVNFFATTHDWHLIGKAIAWGEKIDEETPTRASVTAALLSFCRTFPTQTPQDLLDTRVEGFFYLRDGANEALRGPDADLEEGDVLAAGGGIADGSGLINDPERRSPLWGAIDDADKRVQ